MPDVKFEGEVTRFASVLDPSTRTMKTEIDLPNAQGLLRPGMYGNVTLVLESHPAALTLPAATLVTEQGQHFVFVLKDNKAYKVKVTTGIDDGIRVEILSGLQGNEAIIVAGASMLTDGGPVRAVDADAAGRHQAGAK
jgi:RND family efflux transporter MFP subunit